MKRSLLLAVLSFMLVSSNAQAGDFEIELASDLAQSEFKELSKQAATVIAYRPLAPASSLGIMGFDVGIEASTVDIDSDASFWQKAVQGNDPPGSVLVPKVHIQKGLPFGIDLGLVYSSIPGSDVAFAGAEVKYAIIDGGILFPALALRGTYTKLMGVDELDLNTYGADISVSKGLAMFTPYVGVGQTFYNASEKVDNLALEDEKDNFTHGFAGVKFSLLIINFVAEADFGEVNTYSARANVGLDLF